MSWKKTGFKFKKGNLIFTYIYSSEKKERILEIAEQLQELGQELQLLSKKEV